MIVAFVYIFVIKFTGFTFVNLLLKECQRRDKRFSTRVEAGKSQKTRERSGRTATQNHFLIQSMRRVLAGLCSLLLYAVCAAIVQGEGRSNFPRPHKWNKFGTLLLEKVNEIKFQAEQYLIHHNLLRTPDPNYPYWNFLPQYVASVTETSNTASWASQCFTKNVAVYTKSSDGKSLHLQITSSGALSIGCVEFYFFGTVSSFKLTTGIHSAKGDVITEVTLEVPEDVTDAELWDIDTKGVRIFRYLYDTQTTISNLLETIVLFLPEATLGVPKQIEQMNIDMMQKYMHFEVFPRDPSLNVVPEESEVHSGDAFYTMRLDGLDTMLAWVMGSTTGHVATAMWIDGILYVCESTTAAAWWPTDYIQKTPFKQWVQQNEDAQMQVVWAPLSESNRAKYNETAAVEWYKSVEGLDYGFQTLLWGWIDTEKENFPCLPPDFSSNCMQWELLELFVSLIDRAVPEIGDMIWNQGFNKRLGTSGLRTAELLQESAKQGKTPTEVMIMPESDDWLYNTTRNGEPTEGRAMVCCVFVCGTWKAAGLFGELTDQFNCAEFTDWDDVGSACRYFLNSLTWFFSLFLLLFR